MAVVSPRDIRDFRVHLEVPLSEAASALGLPVVQYGYLERGKLFFKDESQWTKAKALLKNSQNFVG